jgi:glycosyltransferase involved in cell wall biosynthesis
MRFLFLSELYYPHYGGAELATYLYAKKLVEKGHEVTVLTHRFSGESQVEDYDGYKVIRLPLINSDSPKYSIQGRVDVLASATFRHMVASSDIVYVPRLWYSAIPFVRSMHKPVIVHLHDYQPVCPMATLYDAKNERACQFGHCGASCVLSTERQQKDDPVKIFASTLLNTTLGSPLGWLAKLGDALVCVSKRQREILLERAPNLRGKTHVVYNPMRSIENVELKGVEFGYFGGRSLIKGVRVLYDAVNLLESGSCEVPIIHASKMLQDGKITSDPKKKSGLHPYGRLSSDGFNQMYNMVQTVIVPSVWEEPLPYVVAEALIRERLVIASRIGGIPELVEGCPGVILCEPGNAEKLANAIESVLNMDQSEKISLGKRNSLVFKRRFNDDENIGRFLKIAESII